MTVVDEKAIAKWKQSLEEAQEKWQIKPDETEDTEIVIVGSGNTLDMGNAPTVEDLEKKSKSLRASWKRTTRVQGYSREEITGTKSFPT